MKIADPALAAWFELAYSISPSQEEQSDDEATEEKTDPTEEKYDEKFVAVGKAIFSMPQPSSANDVIGEIKRLYDVYVPALPENEDFLVELCLVHAVSKRCSNREAYLQGIITLDASIQNSLEKVVMKYPVADNDSFQEEDDNECHECVVKELEVSELLGQLKTVILERDDALAKYARERELLAEQTAKDITDENVMAQLTDSVEKLEQQLKFSQEKVLEMDISLLEQGNEITNTAYELRERDLKVHDLAKKNSDLHEVLKGKKAELDVSNDVMW
jgi:hypothetical protein